MAYRTFRLLRTRHRRKKGLKGFGLRNLTNPLSSLKFFRKQYGILGIILWLFGSRDVWQMQLQVLHSTSSTDAVSFKESVQNESSIIAVAVSKHQHRGTSSVTKHTQGHDFCSDCDNCVILGRPQSNTLDYPRILHIQPSIFHNSRILRHKTISHPRSLLES